MHTIHSGMRWLYVALLTLMGLLPAMAHADSTLRTHETLNPNEYLESSSGAYRFYLQGDGNLVLRDWSTRKALWSSGTHGKGGVRLVLQSDGNLVLYTRAGKPVWASNTVRSGATQLKMQSDGNLVLYRADGRAVWATGTHQPAGQGSGTGSDALSLARAIRDLGGTIILDWDNTIDIDSDYTIGSTAPRWMNAFAEAGVDAWLVTGNGNRSAIERAVMSSVSSANQGYWKNLLQNKAFYGESTGQKEDKYARIIGSRPDWQFMLVDDASANIRDFQSLTGGQGYTYEPDRGYARYDEMVTHLTRFRDQLASHQGGSGNTGGKPGTTIRHIGTTSVWDSNGQGVTVSRPAGVQAGDLLVLVLHRTDDHLPFEVPGWTRAAECYKEDNGYQCLNVADCSSRDGRFCDRFKGKYRGRDLAQVVLYREATGQEPSRYSFDLNKDSSGHPGWAILTALRGADTENPVRDWANRGCDNHPDSLFPSVRGKKGDMVLLSMSFDDAVSQSRFGAPDGTQTFGYVSRSDEAGFLFGGILSRDGETGELKTHGSGASSCKDALVSLTIRPR